MIKEFKTINQPSRETETLQKNVREVVDDARVSLGNTRYPKPGFYGDSVNRITVPFTSNESERRLLNIAGTIVKPTEDLHCDLSVSGVGGLREGLTLSNITPYYLYGIMDGSNPSLVADIAPPTEGLTGFGIGWTYFGAFATDEFSGEVNEFSSVNGLYISNWPMGTKQQSPFGEVLFEFEAMPLTVDKGYFFIEVDGTVPGSGGTIQGVSGLQALVVTLQVSGVPNYSTGFVPVRTPKSVYVFNSSSSNVTNAHLAGWQEDVMRFQ